MNRFLTSFSRTALPTILALLVLQSFACATEVTDSRSATFAESRRGADVGGLQLTAAVVQPGSVELKGKTEISFTLKNVSKEDQTIYQAHPTVDYILCIEDEKGKQSTFGPMVGAFYAQVERVLKPNEEVTEVYSTESDRLFAKQGKYRITGSRMVWRERSRDYDYVTSNTVEFNVTNSSPDSTITPLRSVTISISSADMCLNAAKRNLSPNASKLQFTATPAQRKVALDSMVIINIKIRNISKSTIPIYAGEDWSIYEYAAMGPDGTEIGGMVESFGKPTGSVKKLKPGQSFFETYRFYPHGFKTPGKCSMTLVRHLGKYPSKKEGSIISNTFDLELTKPAPKK